ncbi:MAG: glycosyltransferase family 9 protein [Pseudomonadota bacterium]|nr:glycosyltransferase family 9 protein [Pseudomonadota bacterium]
MSGWVGFCPARRRVTAVNIDFQRKVDRIAGSLICRALSVLPSFKRKTIEHPPRRVLVILLSEMGSLVLASPMFRKLRQRYPQAEIHALVFEKNREVLDLLDVMPPENVLTIRDTGFGSLARDSLCVIRELRRLRCDAVIDCELFARISSIFSYFSGAPLKSGFFPYNQEGLYRGGFINRPVPYNPYQHLSVQFLNLLEGLEAAVVPGAKRLLPNETLDASQVAISTEEIDALRDRLLGDFSDIFERPLVLVYPSGGILPIRAWPPGHYIRFCRRILEAGYAVVVIGLDSDKALAEELVGECGLSHCYDLTGYTGSVRELLVLFHMAALLVTNDGGPGQFAAMTPIPTIIFFGPETPLLYGTLSQRAYSFHLPVSCSPCLTAYNHRASPCDGDNICLKEIEPDRVYDKAMEFLRARADDV